jgi:SpoVK/Ycf46/Vps4 family AAA+-type ATPase
VIDAEEEEEEEESDDDDDAEADKRLWDSAAYIHALPAARLQLLLKQADLMSAVEELRPSVSEAELRHYEKLAGTYGANV